MYFFIHLSPNGGDLALALMSIYTKPNPTILPKSHNTLWSCKYRGDLALRFVDVKTIQSVVAIIPHMPAIEGSLSGRFFLVEKLGFDVAIMAGIEEDIPDNEGGEQFPS